ncbi:hypothetical protein DLAC_11535 [Tieghemostelium lacteum]|uniref:Uncharacterized protein n=1 Tax=Tieghemostelium lacteum TaxID=361077 RepID=A0A152A4C5_TIELA|nr:hypothetical protein DLAC_11535 [Tieghemostelium lacteum]|eukprot:KYR00925.1 hypothetical protein DLAC_11535 [Tieghemostelium lacteum]
MSKILSNFILKKIFYYLINYYKYTFKENSFNRFLSKYYFICKQWSNLIRTQIKLPKIIVNSFKSLNQYDSLKKAGFNKLQVIFDIYEFSAPVERIIRNSHLAGNIYHLKYFPVTTTTDIHLLENTKTLSVSNQFLESLVYRDQKDLYKQYKSLNDLYPRLKRLNFSFYMGSPLTQNLLVPDYKLSIVGGGYLPVLPTHLWHNLRKLKISSFFKITIAQFSKSLQECVSLESLSLYSNFYHEGNTLEELFKSLTTLPLLQSLKIIGYSKSDYDVNYFLGFNRFKLFLFSPNSKIKKIHFFRVDFVSDTEKVLLNDDLYHPGSCNSSLVQLKLDHCKCNNFDRLNAILNGCLSLTSLSWLSLNFGTFKEDPLPPGVKLHLSLQRQQTLPNLTKFHIKTLQLTGYTPTEIWKQIEGLEHLESLCCSFDDAITLEFSNQILNSSRQLKQLQFDMLFNGQQQSQSDLLQFIIHCLQRPTTRTFKLTRPADSLIQKQFESLFQKRFDDFTSILYNHSALVDIQISTCFYNSKYPENLKNLIKDTLYC